MTGIQDPQSNNSGQVRLNTPLAPARVDSAHRLASAEGRQSPAAPPQDAFADPAEQPALPTALPNDAHRAEQLRVQAEQLAAHLRARQRDLDQREFQLHARIAQFENELRMSRLWIRERARDFADRENQLNQRQAQLDQQERCPV